MWLIVCCSESLVHWYSKMKSSDNCMVCSAKHDVCWLFRRKSTFSRHWSLRVLKRWNAPNIISSFDKNLNSWFTRVSFFRWDIGIIMSFKTSVSIPDKDANWLCQIETCVADFAWHVINCFWLGVKSKISVWILIVVPSRIAKILVSQFKNVQWLLLNNARSSKMRFSCRSDLMRISSNAWICCSFKLGSGSDS